MVENEWVTCISTKTSTGTEESRGNGFLSTDDVMLNHWWDAKEVTSQT